MADEETLSFVARLKSKRIASRSSNGNNVDKDEKSHPIARKKYSAKDVKNIKVGHDVSDLMSDEQGSMSDKGEKVLILKDSNVLDEEDDELINMETLEKEKQKIGLENKRKIAMGSAFQAYEEDFENGEEEDKILSHYNDTKKKSFLLGSKPNTNPSNAANLVRMTISEKLKTNSILLENANVTLKDASDYQTNEEVEFRKLKKKKRQRQKVDLDFLEGEFDTAGDVEMTTSSKRHYDRNQNFVDDDDLQAALARTRQSKTRIKKIKKAEEIAAEVLKERLIQDEKSSDLQGENAVFLSSTSEFVKGLSNAAATASLASSSTFSAVSTLGPKDIVEDDTLVQGLRIKSPSPRPIEMVQMDIAEADSPEIVNNNDYDNSNSNNTAGMEEEPSVGSSVAATLSLLQKTGAFGASGRKNQVDVGTSSNPVKDSASNTKSSQYNKSSSDSDKLKNYKPQVKLEYYDELGRELGPKDAYRQLCYKFHGIAPGKNKTEKILKRIREDDRIKKMESTDTPLHLSSVLQNTQKALGSSHLVLSVGNRVALNESLPANLIKTSSSSNNSNGTSTGIIGSSSRTSASSSAALLASSGVKFSLSTASSLAHQKNRSSKAPKSQQ